jgi:IPT/TIG domain
MRTRVRESKVMALFEGKTPAERNKMIAAVVLPLLVLILLVRMFSGGPPAPTTNTTGTNSNRNRTNQQRAQTANQNSRGGQPDADAEFNPTSLTRIVCCAPPYGGPDAGRNIFAFYVKPTPTPQPEAPTPPPTPTPTPPILLASLSPQSVFAKTGNLTLQLSGDKFGPADRVYIEGQELPTQYRSVQQLTATVPAALIGGPGSRNVMVRTPDGRLFSNPQTLNVMQPPAPTYTYVGFLKRARSNSAMLKDSKGELYTVREGDIVEGRFRVSEISERGVEVVDKDLNIKHTLPYISSGSGFGPNRAPGSIQPPPPPSSDDGDEEP